MGSTGLVENITTKGRFVPHPIFFILGVAPFPTVTPFTDLPMNLLLTGFGLWGIETTNSSWEAIRNLDLDLPGNWTLRRRQLPVDWERGPATLRDLIDDTIGAALCFGMFGGDPIRVEQRAVNRNDRTRRDAREALADSDRVVEDGPPAYPAALDGPALVKALRRADLPATESHNTGDFLCNGVFYTLMHERERRHASFPAGFIHLPPIASADGLSLDRLQEAARICANHVIGLADRRASAPTESSTPGSSGL